jgi:hypothetical protein
MDTLRIPNRLLLLVAFVVCIALGFTLAVVLRERLGGGTAEEDPCFGQGELVESWEAELTQEDIDEAVAASRPDLAEMEPGVVEFRRCRSGPGYEVLMDEYGHVYSFSQPTLEEMEAYYEEHPEESFLEQLERELQESYVPSGLPEDQTAGCDPSWEKTTLDAVKAVVCHPPGWAIRAQDEGIVWIGTETGGVGVLAPEHVVKSYDASLACENPELLAVPGGTAKLCTLGGELGEEQAFGLILPSGRHLYASAYQGATDEDKAIILRVAVNVEDLS